MKKLALLAITGYQKYISPYKGFSCAYRVATKELSCSAYGKKVISKYGVKKGLGLLNRRLKDCKFCNEELNKNKIKRYRNKQSGDCDVGGCDPSCFDISGCDFPDISGCGDSFSMHNCNSCDLIPDYDACDFWSDIIGESISDDSSEDKTNIRQQKIKEKFSLEEFDSDDNFDKENYLNYEEEKREDEGKFNLEKEIKQENSKVDLDKENFSLKDVKKK